MGAEATLRPDSLPVVPGGEAYSEIVVRNTGQVVDSFALSVIGEAAAWAACEPAVLSLFPGQTAAARVIVRPPAGSQVPHGRLPFAIRVASTEDPAGSVVEEGILAVAPMPLVTADLAPRTGRGRGLRPSRHKVIIDNHGNAPASVELIGGDDADTVYVQVIPPGLVVGPAATATARVRVRARRRFWRGPSETHQFHVIASPQDGDLQRCDGAMVQTAMIPSWLPKAAALAAVGVIALAALWFGLVRPAVQRAATGAALAALHRPGGARPGSGATAGAGANPESPPAGAGAGSPSAKATPGSPTPKPASSSPSAKASTSKPASSSPPVSPSPKTSTPPARPAPVPFMTVLSSGTTSLAEAARHQLAITDLVIQDPAGDQGILSLTLNGATIYTEQLADFPDYDLHFLTPIIVGAGQSLRMTVTCGNPGGKACTPAVLVTGMDSSS
jgi:hypothetical protein